MLPGDPSRDGDPRRKLVYDDAVHAIDRQQVRLDEVRKRAANIFTAASISGGFLGAEVFKAPEGLNVWAWLAAGAFTLNALLLGYILWPRTWLFKNKTDELQSLWIDQSNLSLDEIHTQLAAHTAKNYTINDAKLRRLAVALEIMVIAVLVVLGALVVNLARSENAGRSLLGGGGL